MFWSNVFESWPRGHSSVFDCYLHECLSPRLQGVHGSNCCIERLWAAIERDFEIL